MREWCGGATRKSRKRPAGRYLKAGRRKLSRGNLPSFLILSKTGRSIREAPGRVCVWQRATLAPARSRASMKQARSAAAVQPTSRSKKLGRRQGRVWKRPDTSSHLVLNRGCSPCSRQRRARCCDPLHASIVITVPAGTCANHTLHAFRRRSCRRNTRPEASTAHIEHTLFAKSTPMVIVRMATSSSVDGCVAKPSWPSRR